jgi:hypothetical protein
MAMKLMRGAGAVAIAAISLRVALPVIVDAVHDLLVPVVVGVVLYVLVRVVNARLSRW